MVEDQRYDNDTGLYYSSDVGFIDTGTNQGVGVQFTNSYLPMYNTLRSFPNELRNCYTLTPSQGKSSNYLIRASFRYGNYDGLSFVPQFDLYIGVNHWVTVELPSVDHSQFYELIFAPLEDSVYVCLVNIGSGTPFISGLELRPLNNSIYKSTTGALMLCERLDAGWSTTNSSYYYSRSDDPYDREWSAVQPSFAVWRSLSPNISINSTFADAYRLPPSVLKTAAVPLHASGSLVFNWNYSLIGSFQVYWHFAELKKLGSSDLREFIISMTGNYQSGKIIPKYIRSSSIVSPVTKFNGPNLDFNITRTRKSTLPPILNALEIYEVLDTPASVTYQDDVDAMMDIKRNYTVPKTWQGDPCLPCTPWVGLNCSISNVYDSPRITYLNLAFSGLAGEVPHSLSMLTSLVYLNLSYNSLTGFIPDFLAELPSLHTIDLRSNKLTGRVPIALSKKVEDGSLYLSVDGNPDLCVSNPLKKKILKKVGAIFATAASIILIFAAIVVFYRYTRKKQAANIKRRSLKSESSSFTYCEVVNMTNNFRKIIGRGGSGTVYHGCLQDGTAVAVKLLNPSSKHSLKLFCTEAQLLTRVHHRNLVSLLGYSEEGTTLALIYEHVANGSLQQHLSEKKFKVLSWKERLQIAIDAAHGLEYMHSGCEPPILHRDMKTSNILLDEKLQAKISDFGISRAFSAESESSLTTDVVGTHGYLDPEYCNTHRINKRSDVYSFGVVLLELISGRCPIVRISNNAQPIHISAWIAPMLESGDIENIVDKRLQGNYSSHSAWKALEIAMVCVSSIAIKRPSMNQVLVDLDDCLAIEIAQGGDTHSKNNGYAYSACSEDVVDIAITDTKIDRGPWAR